MPHQMEYDYYPDPVDLPYEFPETYVVCHITQNWPNRTWPTENWQKFVDLLGLKIKFLQFLLVKTILKKYTILLVLTH
jgi:ADP-heptose:LPS heptosyltransferase